MSGSSRRRGSKWDMKEDISPENRHDLARSNNAGNSFNERESRDYMSGRREFQRDDRINEENLLSWDGGRRQQSRSRSPRRSRATSYKSKSRSRSRSPAQNSLQWEPSGHRSNNKSGHSAPLCRDFTAGRCKKGNDCWFSHHTSPNHDNRRQFDNRTVDNWENRRGNDGASRHQSENYSSGGRSKYRHHDSGSDEFSKRETDRSYRDGGNDWRNSEPICKFFAAGNCRNGKHCKFSHHQREVSQFNHERRSPDVSRRREHNDDPNWGDFRDSRKSKSGDENMTSNGNQWERNDGSVPEIKRIEKGFGEQDIAQRVSTENQYPSFPVDITPGLINNTFPTNFPLEQGISEPIRQLGVENVQMAPQQPVLDSNLGAFATNNQNQGLLIPHREPIVDPNQTDNSGVQNSSINEQLVQYSNLSATLVQLLEKRQQLPQLYAAITQQTASVLPPEQTKQYDPLSDSVETNPATNLVGELQDKDHEVKEEEPAESDKEENGEEKENEANETAGPADEVDADENKKAKEAKGIRPFKFALAEFVKELLKPVWKEGKMSKEVYKNIVKKVVDKVTDTIQVAHIPRTKEKIDQYLSLSKPKLNKLTQAYLEKYHKT